MRSSILRVVAIVVVAGSTWLGCAAGAGSGQDPSGGGSLPATGGGQGTVGAGGSSSSGTGGSNAGGDNPAGTGGSSTMAGGTGTGGAPGGAGSTGAAGSGPVITPANRGATLPYLEYEAEDADTNGTRLGPSRKFGDVAAESSQRKAVRLDATGQYVHFVSKNAANSIVVRYSIPDSADGSGNWTTLSVYVNGTKRSKLSISSRWAWTYGDFGNPRPNDPAQGKPHHFYDEAHALVGDIPAGATVSIQRDADDTAPYYIIDLIDLEQVAAPLPQPANFVSITDCGATPDDDSDDQPAIQACIDQAHRAGKGLYIPKGTFRSIAKALSVDNVTIRGAGMWYSTIYGFNARFDCYGSACKYYDFLVSGDTTLRNDSSPESGFSGVTGNGTILQNIWVEHSKTGYWVGPAASALNISHCRFRDLYADGINLWHGTSNSVVEQSHFRNTGDDALASWSDSASNTNNVFRFNTVQVPWMANCFGIYGGNGNRIEDSVCQDVVQYPGILIAQQFNSQPFQGTTAIVRTSVIRAGGPAYNDEQGAIKFYAEQGNMGGFLVQDSLIQDSTFSGIHLQGPNRIDNLRFQNVTVSTPGTWGIRVNADAKGSATANTLVLTNARMDDESKGAFAWTKEAGNSGW